ncbi:MAG: hypothetical protein RLZZ481_1040 [Pseudomonadota bacterium]|jgi:aspartyl-tRNA(Asn)/glutamyl-tRNA(Gln) amidotransferase subunit A
MTIELLDKSALLEQSIIQISQALRRGETSSVQLTQTALARARQVEPQINAFIELREEQALEQAQTLDREAAQGRWRGPLHGVPLAHKDCFERQGLPTTVGSKVTGTALGTRTATALSLLEQAGAVDLGPLSMNEMVAGPTGQNPHFGDCRNSWDTERISGGSSSGSGAAVGAAVVYGSLGSDTGGSIRLPASMNGLFGLKPTYGRVSRAGCFPRAFSLDCVGPLTRSAQDCALILQAVAGSDARDASSAVAPVPDYPSLLESAALGSRVGVLSGITSYHPEIEEGLEGWLQIVHRCFGPVDRVVSDEIKTCYAMADVFSKVEAATLHGDWMRERAKLYSQAVFSRTEPGLHIPAVRYLEALQMRAKILNDFLTHTMKNFDVLLCPTMPIPVPTREEADVESAGRVFGVVAALTPLTRPFSYLGLPVLTMPMGCDQRGLPMGVQLIGRPFGEARLLSMAHLLEVQSGWNRLVQMRHAQQLKG